MDGEVARPLPPGAETSSSRTITPIPKSSHAWGAWGPHPEAPLSHPWAPQAHRGPLLPIHKEPSTHGNASQGCILCIVLSKVGGGEDAGAKPCRTDLCSGPENGSKLQNSRKRKKKSTTMSPRPSARGSRQTPVVLIRASLGRGEGTSLSLPLGDTLSSLSFMAHDCFAPLRNSPFVQRRQRVRAPQRLRGKRKATEASRNIIRNLNMTPLLHSETWHHKTPGL